MYTTVREFVENSLDAAEAIGVLPEVSVAMCAPRARRAARAESRRPCSRSCADARANGAARRSPPRCLPAWWGWRRGGASTKRCTKTRQRRRRRRCVFRRRRSVAGADVSALRRPQKREAAAEKRRLAAAAKARARLVRAAASGWVPHSPLPSLPQKRKAEEEAGGVDGDDGAPAAEREKDKGGAAKREKAPSGPIYYRVTVKDNGKGMAHEDIPNMLGRVLSGTKYGVRQARGKFGLGAKMALIWAKQTTGQPITVRSAKPGQSFVSAYTLDLDLRTNAPHIHAEAKEANPERWHGSEVSVLIRGAWSTYGSRIVKYLRQLAVITPYAQLTFKYASEAGGRADVALRFCRRTAHMPPPPAETAYHPSAVDLETIRALMRNTTCKTMRSFLCKGMPPPLALRRDCAHAGAPAEFTSIDGALADRLLAECGHGVTPGGDPKALQAAQVMALHRLLAAAKFEPPSGDCLSPAGEYNLRLGVMKELRPELVATYCGAVVRLCVLCVLRRFALIVRVSPRRPAQLVRGPPVHGGGCGVVGRPRRQAGPQRLPLRQPHPAAFRARQRRGDQAGAGCGLGPLQDRKSYSAPRHLRLRRFHASALPRHRQRTHRGGRQGACRRGTTSKFA